MKKGQVEFEPTYLVWQKLKTDLLHIFLDRKLYAVSSCSVTVGLTIKNGKSQPVELTDLYRASHLQATSSFFHGRIGGIQHQLKFNIKTSPSGFRDPLTLATFPAETKTKMSIDRVWRGLQPPGGKC